MKDIVKCPELTIIVISSTNDSDVRQTMDSIARQSFTDYEVVHVDDERSALDYVSGETRGGNEVLFLRTGDLLAVQMTLEENVRILKEKDEVDVVFFPWVEIRGGWPYTYDAYFMQWLRPGFNKIAEAIRRVTSGNPYGKIFRRRLFDSVDLSGYSKFTPELTVALICNAKGLHWSPNGLYFHNRVRNELIDDFRFTYSLLHVLYTEKGSKSVIYANSFFIVLERLSCLMSEHNLDFSEENAWLKVHIPDFSCVLHSMKREYKRGLIFIKIFGYGCFMKHHFEYTGNGKI